MTVHGRVCACWREFALSQSLSVRAWNRSGRWTLPAPVERATAPCCIPTSRSVFDISPLRGNRWHPQRSGSAFAEESRGWKLNVEKPAQNSTRIRLVIHEQSSNFPRIRRTACISHISAPRKIDPTLYGFASWQLGIGSVRFIGASPHPRYSMLRGIPSHSNRP